MAGFEPWTRERGAEIIAGESRREGATLPILHALQAAFGYVHAEAVPMIADAPEPHACGGVRRDELLP